MGRSHANNRDKAQARSTAEPSPDPVPRPHNEKPVAVLPQAERHSVISGAGPGGVAVFDILVGLISALNQIGVLIAALVCGGLGALLVGHAIYWRLHAVRVQGQVIGVRQCGNIFNAVYRYTLPSGQICEATSLEGSDSTRGKQTGAVAPLLVIPEKPDEVQEARHHVFTVIGAALLAACAGLFYYAATAFRVGPMTWIAGGLVLAHFLERMRQIVLPKDKRLQLSAWRQMLAERNAAELAAMPVRRLEDLASLPAERAREVRQNATLRRVAPFLLIAGIGLFALGVHQSRALVRLESFGVRARGVVSSLASSSGSGSSTYYAVVTYTDQAGRRARFRDNAGSNPPMYHVNESVTVLYSPTESGNAIIDRGIWNWLPSALLYLLGVVLSVVSIALLKRRGTEASTDVATGSALP